MSPAATVETVYKPDGVRSADKNEPRESGTGLHAALTYGAFVESRLYSSEYLGTENKNRYKNRRRN